MPTFRYLQILPANFRIIEPGIEWEARIIAKEQEKIEIWSKNPNIKIELSDWHEMFHENRGAFDKSTSAAITKTSNKIDYNAHNVLRFNEYDSTVDVKFIEFSHK